MSDRGTPLEQGAKAIYERDGRWEWDKGGNISRFAAINDARACLTAAVEALTLDSFVEVAAALATDLARTDKCCAALLRALLGPTSGNQT